MMMQSMPGFLAAWRAVRALRPDLPRHALQRAAQTERREFARLRMTSGLLERWAEFYALTARAA